MAALAACNGGEHGSPGQTPNPDATSIAQANSTAAPERSSTNGTAAAHYRVVTDAKTKGLTFSVFVSGAPAFSLNGPNQTRDLSKSLKMGSNGIGVRWQKHILNGTGTLTVTQSGKQVLMKVYVAPNAAKTGQQSGTIQAH